MPVNGPAVMLAASVSGEQATGRVAGIIGCLVVAVSQWWLGLLLLVMWLVVRRVVLAAVLRQAIDMRARTTVMRRSWSAVLPGYALTLAVITEAARTHQIGVRGWPSSSRCWP